MTIGNKPKQGGLPVLGKRYWWLSIGQNAIPNRYFEGGWRAFEFVVLTPYTDLTADPKMAGTAHPYSFRIAFAFWLPFYSL